MNTFTYIISLYTYTYHPCKYFIEDVCGGSGAGGVSIFGDNFAGQYFVKLKIDYIVYIENLFY